MRRRPHCLVYARRRPVHTVSVGRRPTEVRACVAFTSFVLGLREAELWSVGRRSFRGLATVEVSVCKLYPMLGRVLHVVILPLSKVTGVFFQSLSVFFFR